MALPPINLPIGQESQPRTGTESLSSTLVESSSSNHSNSSLSSSHSSSDSDSSDSDSDSDSDSSDGDEEEEEEESELLLNQLLIKAKQSAKQRETELKEQAKKMKTAEEDGLAGNEEMVLFGGQDDESSDDDEEEGTPKASTSKSISTSSSLPPSLVRPLSLPTSYSSSSTLSKGKARAGPISLAQDLSGVLSNEGVTVVGSSKGRVISGGEDGDKNGLGEKWGVAPVARLSKKAYKASQPHTAGSKWFDMPATPMTPELKREIDAMRLRNALDPKKFMKGGAKKEKIGEFFQIGHVITPNSRATTNNSLPTASKRSFVEELVEDEQARAYAKRKTKEVMMKGMSGRKRQRKGGKGSYAMGQGGGKDGMGEAGGKRRKR